MIGVALTVVAAVAAGVATEHRFGKRTERLARRLLTAMLWMLVPFVVFFNIARLHITVGVGAGILLAYLTLALCATICFFAGTRLLGLNRPEVGAAMCSTIQANTGYLGLPLAATIFTHAQFAQAVAFDALVQAPAFVIAGFAIGAAFGTNVGPRRRDRVRAVALRNPPLLALIAGLIAPASLAPDALVSATHVMVFALLVVGFFAVGITLATEAEDGALKFPPPLTRPIAMVVGLRIVLVPTLLLAFSVLVIDLPRPYLLLAGMPTGINALVVAHATGLDVKLTSSAIAWSTALVLVVVLVLTAGGVL